MFAHELPDAWKLELLEIVRLLQVFEAPLLWDGKKEDELTGNTDLSKINFSISDALEQIWQNAVRIYGDDVDLKDEDSTGIIQNLLDQIRELRIPLQNNKEARLEVAEATLKNNIFGNDSDLRTIHSSAWGFLLGNHRSKIKAEGKKDNYKPTYPRIVLFEAMRLSFQGSELSPGQKSLLQLVSVAYGIDGESFGELFSQAITLRKEMKRSNNLVLE